nr:MAG TPA: hypothetical protein [Caudoviricetes sp.]
MNYSEVFSWKHNIYQVYTAKSVIYIIYFTR